jgi:hypothetical protein
MGRIRPLGRARIFLGLRPGTSLLGLGALLALAGCSDSAAPVAGLAPATTLAADPNMKCAIALLTAGGAAEAAGNVEQRSHYEEKIQFFLGRVAMTHPRDLWFSYWRRQAVALAPAEQQRRIQDASGCVQAMADEFKAH